MAPDTDDGGLPPKSFKVGVDVGGTFTDIVLVGPYHKICTKKVLSTPYDPSIAFIDGVRKLCAENAIDLSSIDWLVHGTTIVTNACIEKKGAKVGLITTKGFRDILGMGRGRAPVALDLTWSKPAPLVPRGLRKEVTERIDSRGKVRVALDPREVRAVIRSLKEEEVEAIAVCLINSPLNSKHEKAIEKLLREISPNTPVSISSDVMPMIGEYERTSETVFNAYVVPLVSKYLSQLNKNLKAAGINAPLFIMQSSGGMTTAENASLRPIEIIECGPAGGVVGAAFLARQQGIPNLITFDMGGTTAKASIVENGRYARMKEYEVGGEINQSSRMLKGSGYVVRVPSIDIAEIGAGGGSILRVDTGGALHVGPQSAGASPGPACYDQGGELPTLTDANLVLGYINPTHLCGGEFPLNASKARAVIEEKLAGPLNRDLYAAAFSAHLLANALMMRAIRAVSSERGRDPRKFELYAFGGAGPIHAAGVAVGLGVKTVIVPRISGVFSAYGLLTGNIERHYTRSFLGDWRSADISELNRLRKAMIDDAISTSSVWGGALASTPKIEVTVELQYTGQGSTLAIPLPSHELQVHDIELAADEFQKEHERTYGHQLIGQPIRATELRIAAIVDTEEPFAKNSVPEKRFSVLSKNAVTREAYWGPDHGKIQTPVCTQMNVGPACIFGPVLIDCYDTTIVVPPEATVKSGDNGDIVINLLDRG